jgi:hypothetical protein
MDGLRRRLIPTPSMGVAVTALVVALGGTSYAVVKPSPRSVGSKELKRNAVTAAKIKRNAVNSSKVRNDSLTGSDINEGALGPVARAALADRATSVDQAARAGIAGGLDRVVYRVATVSVPAAPAPGDSSTGSATARCDAGQLVVGGGAKLDEQMSLVDSFPEAAASWIAHVNNDDPLSARSATVYAVCITATTPG